MFEVEANNIEYGNIDYEKVIIESGNIEFNFENSNIDSKTGSNGAPRGVKRGHSIPYHHQRSPPHPRGTPFDPILLSMLPFLKLNSMLPLSMITFS